MFKILLCNSIKNIKAYFCRPFQTHLLPSSLTHTTNLTNWLDPIWSHAALRLQCSCSLCYWLENTHSLKLSSGNSSLMKLPLTHKISLTLISNLFSEIMSTILLFSNIINNIAPHLIFHKTHSIDQDAANLIILKPKETMWIWYILVCSFIHSFSNHGPGAHYELYGHRDITTGKTKLLSSVANLVG